MKKNSKVFILLIVGFISSYSEFYTLHESDILLLGLKNNKEIKLSNSNKQYDSLSLCAVKAGWIPIVNVSFNPNLNVPLQNNNSTINTSLSSGITQPLPGGGMMKANVAHVLSQPLSDSTRQESKNIKISYEQPLLQNAGKLNNLQYSINLETLENRKISLETGKAILSVLSSMRVLYWDLIAQRLYESTYKQELLRSEEQLKTDRARFTIGDASELDTLSTSFSNLQNQQKSFENNIALSQCKNKLALALSISPDSFDISDSIDLTVHDLPDPSMLLSLVVKYDPSLKIFENAQQKLLLMQQKNRNSLLPAINGELSYNVNNIRPSITGSSRLTENVVIGLLFSYDIPKKKERIGMQQLNLQINNSKLNEEKYRAELGIKLKELSDLWQQEKKRIELAKKSLSIAKHQYAVAEKAFGLGTIDRQAFQKIKDDLVESDISLIRMSIEMKKLEIIFDELSGTLFERFGISY